MVERNSKLREKIMDMLILLLSIHGAKAMYTAELIYSVDIEVIQNRYYKNRGFN